MVSEPALRANGIGVAFAGVWVLSDVSVDILPGEIHGLIGENGAGKSTLGKVFGGYYAASAGTLDVFGERASAWDPLSALSKGVAIMHRKRYRAPILPADLILGLTLRLDHEPHRRDRDDRFDFGIWRRCRCCFG